MSEIDKVKEEVTNVTDPEPVTKPDKDVVTFDDINSEEPETPEFDDTGEVWVDVLGYEGYYHISNLGRVKSLKRIVVGRDDIVRHLPEVILKNNGVSVNLSESGKATYIFIKDLMKSFDVPNPKTSEGIDERVAKEVVKSEAKDGDSNLFKETESAVPEHEDIQVSVHNKDSKIVMDTVITIMLTADELAKNNLFKEKWSKEVIASLIQKEVHFHANKEIY